MAAFSNLRKRYPCLHYSGVTAGTRYLSYTASQGFWRSSISRFGNDQKTGFVKLHTVAK